MTADVAVIAVVAQEPARRLASMAASVASQRPTPPTLIIACPPLEVADVRTATAIAGLDAYVIPNATGRRSAGLNAAWRAARAEVIVRIDARARFAPDHVERCLDRLRHPEIGVVGAHQVPEPFESGVVAAGVCRTLGNPLVLGAPMYRRRNAWGDADTVYLGAFRTADLLDLEGWNEDLDANEDFELCQRYLRRGFRVWLERDLDVRYEPRASLRHVFQQYHLFGRAKVQYWRLTGERPNLRQAAAVALGLAVASAMVPGRTRAVAAAVGGATLFALDAAGAGAAPFATRAVSTAASASVLAGWLSGVAYGVLEEPLHQALRKWISRSAWRDRRAAL